MEPMKVTIDDKDFQTKLAKFLANAIDKKNKAVRDIASEVLRISQFQVPHDIGTLQNSGFVQDGNDEALVGYNTKYAARLHEHPEYRFRNGRKGKYLEDPIKENRNTFLQYYKSIIS